MSGTDRQTKLSKEAKQALLDRVTTHQNIELSGDATLQINPHIDWDRRWSWLAITLLLSGCTLLEVHDEHSFYTPITIVGWTLFGSAIVCYILFYLFTTYRFLIDLKERNVMFHWKFFHWEKCKEDFAFSSLLGAFALCTKKTNKDDTKWDYKVVLVAEGDRRVYIQIQSEDAFVQCNQLVEDLGALLGCESFPCVEQKENELVFDEEEQEIEVKPRQRGTYPLKRLVIFGGLVVLIIAGVLYIVVESAFRT